MKRKKDGKLLVMKKSHKTIEKMNHIELKNAKSEAKLAIELGNKGSAFIIRGHEAFINPEDQICIILEYA